MKYKSLTFLGVTLTLLLSYNFLSAAWSAPSGTPPSNNTDAPINVGATTQTKNGTLNLSGLGVNGLMTVSATSPNIRFESTDVSIPLSRILQSTNSLVWQFDRNRNTSFDDGPHPISIFASSTSAGDYTTFSNRVRATEYCDRNGANCFAPATVGGTGSFLTTGSTTQTKTGVLGLYGLLIEGVQTIAAASPNIAFTDTDAGTPSSRILYNNSSLLWQLDRNNNGLYDDGQPMRVVAGAVPDEDFVQFSSKVRASEYCDQSGNDCINPADLQDIFAFSDISSYMQTSNPQSLVSPVNPTDTECSCRSGDVLTACTKPGSATGDSQMIAGKNGCYSTTSGNPQCTCITAVAPPGSVTCEVEFSHQFGKGVPVTTEVRKYTTPSSEDVWAIAMFAHKDDWANPSLITTQTIVNTEWGGGDIAFGIGGDASSKGRAGIVSAATYKLGNGLARSNGQTYNTVDSSSNWEVDDFKLQNGQTASIQVTDIFEGTAIMSVVVRACI